MFSRRTSHDARPNALAAAVAARRASGAPLLDLTVANPTVAGFALAPDVLARHLVANDASRYEPAPFGPAVAREAAAEAMGSSPARTIVTASTSESYGYLFTALADPGDELLVPRPSYPLFEWLARFAGLTLVPYELRHEDDFRIDLGSLRSSVTRRTRAILCVSPNHPTGTSVRPEEQAELMRLGLPVVVDEVFSAYPVERPACPWVAVDHGLVFRLSGLSKLAALPQLKVGFLALEGAAPHVSEALARLELVADTYLSVSTPSALAVPALLREAVPVRAAILRRIHANLGALDAALHGSAASRWPVPAGWSAMVRVPSVMTDEEHALALVDRGVTVQPGHFYDLDRPTTLVLSLLCEETAFRAGAHALREHLDRCTR